jgi:hypothetical protein
MKYLRWILLCVLPCIGAVAETAASLPDDAPINLFVGDSRVLEVATSGARESAAGGAHWASTG